MEESILKKLKGIITFPCLYYSKNLILIETLHEPILKELFLLFLFCNKNFPLKAIGYI